MKKLLLIIFVIACVTISKGNPIATPIVTLSELKFESNGDWVIELQYYYMDNRITIDSIWIKSTSGISRLKQFDIRGNICVLLVRNDSLMSDLNINPVSDSIQIIFSSYGYSHMSEPVTYGYTNGMLKSPRAGQSIAATSNSYNNTYSLDNSPTIGGFNDSTGMCGSIKGHIYDKNNQLLTRTNLGFSGLAQDFSPNPDGTYSARIYSCNNHITSFDDYILPYSGRKNGVYISPIYVSIEPDTIVTVDIHLLGSVVDGIDKVQMNEESLFRISPNPIKDLSFKYEISIPVKSSTSYIELISLSGQKMGQFPITENTGKINLPANTANGMYSLRLFVNNKNYATSKIIIAGE